MELLLIMLEMSYENQSCLERPHKGGGSCKRKENMVRIVTRYDQISNQTLSAIASGYILCTSTKPQPGQSE